MPESGNGRPEIVCITMGRGIPDVKSGAPFLFYSVELIHLDVKVKEQGIGRPRFPYNQRIMADLNHSNF
ncbi:MAG: hypothetical protein LWW85_08285 [Marinilabiliales bacterium]|nr:hypothetical protein [Marinilabiliales bacterium]